MYWFSCSFTTWVPAFKRSSRDPAGAPFPCGWRSCVGEHKTEGTSWTGQTKAAPMPIGLFVPQKRWKSVPSSSSVSLWFSSPFQIHTRRAFPSQSPPLQSRRLQVAWMRGRLWWFPVIPQVSGNHSWRCVFIPVCLCQRGIDYTWRDSEALQVSLIVIPDSAAFVGAPSTRVRLLGLLLRTAWASNSCDKYSSHGDLGHFSQTNNSRMFICGSLHLGHSACLPLSQDRGIGLFALDYSQSLFLSFPPLFLCSFVLFSRLLCVV